MYKKEENEREEEPMEGNLEEKGNDNKKDTEKCYCGIEVAGSKENGEGG